jgi:hypothetical protein
LKLLFPCISLFCEAAYARATILFVRALASHF